MTLPPPKALPTSAWRAKFVAASSDPNFPYDQTERPRFLEEGLNWFFEGLPPDVVFGVAALCMMKVQPKMLERLALKWMDMQEKIIHGLAQAGAGNIVSAYGSNFLIALMLEQNYLIRQRGADDLIASLNWIAGAEVAGNLFKDFAVPATLIYSASGGEFPEDTSKILAALRGTFTGGKKKPQQKTDYKRETATQK
jgi:hypothetical protein